MAESNYEADVEGEEGKQNPIEVNSMLDDFLKDSTDLDKLGKYLKQARTAYTGDEWALIDEQNRDGDQLNMKKTKAVIERIVGSVLENSFDLSVTARDLPQTPLEHPFRRVLQEQAPLLAMKGDDEARIISEMLSVATETVREELNLDEKLARALETSLVDGCVIMKDGVTIYNAQMPLTADIVYRENVRVAKDLKDFADVEHLCHEMEIPKDQFLAQFPQCTEADLEEALKSSDQDPEKATHIAFEEHWVMDFTMEEVADDADPDDTYETPVYPGLWRQIIRVGKKILADRPNPHSHQRLPFHCLVGVTDPYKWHGLSLAHDVLYSSASGINKLATMSLLNVAKTAQNKILINPEKVENPEQLVDDSVYVVLKQGATFDEATRTIQGADISNGFNTVSQTLGNHFNDIGGSAEIPPPGSPATSSDVVKSGFRVGMLRRRVKSLLESLTYNLLLNLVYNVNELQSFRLQGGLGDIPYTTFNPHIFAELIDRFHVRFNIHVEDAEQVPADPFNRAKMTEAMMSTARSVSETSGLKLSQSLAVIPSMPGKNTLVRQVRADEYRKEQEAEEARVRGEVAPELQEEQKKMERERADAISEVVKRALQKWGDEDPVAIASLGASGTMSTLFKIAQGLATPQEAQAILPLLPGPLQEAVKAMLALAQQEQMRLQQEQMMQQAQAQPQPQAPPEE